MSRFLRALGALAFTSILIGARAQEFPSRPVRIIVPYAAGNAADIFTRTLADELTRVWGQQVIVDNKSGASGIVAVLEFKKTRGDGHDYILGDVGILAINPSLYRKLPYDAVNDLVPVTDLLHTPWVYFTAKASPVKTVGDLIAAAKANPGRYTFSSNGVGTPTFLAAELLRQRAGIELLHVPYRDGNQMRLAAATGDVTLMTTVMASARPVLDRLTPLALSGSKRNPAYPDVPTVVESGGPPGVESSAWSALMARPEAPAPILRKVHADVVRVLRLPVLQKRSADLGLDPGGRSPEEVAQFIRGEAKNYREVIEAANIQRDL